MLFLDFDSTGAGVVAETKVAETISLSPRLEIHDGRLLVADQ
jgi:hypothetical protein